MSRKLPADAFHAQFHNHEKHMTDDDYVRPFSHEVPKHAPAGPNPDYSRKKRHHGRKSAVEKALHIALRS